MFMCRVNGFAKSKRVSSGPLFVSKRVRACLHEGEDGNTIVEMALMLPVLMTVMLGIFVLGIIFNNYTSLTQAVGSSAEYLQSLNTEPAGTDVCALTWTFMEGVAPTLTPSNLNVTITLNGVVTTGNGTTPPSCSTGTNNMANGVTVTVAATYPCNFVIYGKNYAPGGCLLSQSSSQLIY